MAEIYVKNQLNDGLEIEFCVGDKEYRLEHNEEVTIDVEDGSCMYFDIAAPKKGKRTNYDRLKNLTIEEMAKAMMCPNELSICTEEIECNTLGGVSCVQCCLERLKREVDCD